MSVVVNDANVLIDLVELQLLVPFFKLDIQCHTTSWILNELLDDQLVKLAPFVERGKLQVHSLSESEIYAILGLQKQRPPYQSKTVLRFIRLCYFKPHCSQVTTRSEILQKVIT